MSSKTVTLVQLNDVHAYLEPHQELFWEKGGAVYRLTGGYARISTLVRQIRRETEGDILLADNGDTLHGTYPAVDSQGRALVPILTRLGIDAMTAHWDFAYGPGALRERVAELGYPLLAANVFDTTSHDPAFPSHIVREVNGLRVGVVGLASNIVDKTMPPHFSEGLQFTLGREELPGILEVLRSREKVDLVVLLSHLGFPQDIKLASEVAGIDVILSGHTHNRLFRPAIQGKTIVIQSGAHGSFLGRLDLDIEGNRIAGHRHRLIEVEMSIEPDPEMESVIRDVMTPYREQLSEVVGEVAEPLHRYSMMESSMDNILLQSLLDATGAQIAFSNGWRYGAPIVPGKVFLNDLYNIVPMNPPVSMVELTGTDLLEMLEENLEHTFAGDPYRQMGGYLKRALGIRAYLKVENPRGHRIQMLFVGDEEVQPERSYTAAFVTVQGVPGKYGSNRRQLPERAVEVLRQQLKHPGRVSRAHRGTFSLA